MPTHVYCLTSAPDEPPPGLRGLGGASVRAIGAAGLRAWVSTVDAAAGAPDADAARAHDAVVEAALALGPTPLPARFGQRYDSDAECVHVVTRHADEMRALLARIAGCVEMTVVARLDAPPADEGLSPSPATAEEAAPGRAYLLRKKAELAAEGSVQRLAAEVRRRVSAAVAPLVRGEVVRLVPGPRGATLSLSHLLPRDALPGYRRAVAESRTAPDLPPLVTLGPHAPWRFARLPDGEVRSGA